MKALHNTSTIKSEIPTPVNVNSLFVFWFLVSQSFSANLNSHFMFRISAGEGGFQNSSFVVWCHRTEHWKASIVQQRTSLCCTQKQRFCPFFLQRCLWASCRFSCWSAGALVRVEKRRQVCLQCWIIFAVDKILNNCCHFYCLHMRLDWVVSKRCESFNNLLWF